MPYSGLPATVPTDALKFWVGDTSTSSSDELLSTGECNYLIGLYGSALAAAPHAARALAAAAADEVSKAVGDLRIEAQQRFTNYTTLAASLEKQAALSSGVPFAGGISLAQKQSAEQDTDRVQPAFRVGMHDNPLAGSTST